MKFRNLKPVLLAHILEFGLTLGNWGGVGEWSSDTSNSWGSVGNTGWSNNSGTGNSHNGEESNGLK